MDLTGGCLWAARGWGILRVISEETDGARRSLLRRFALLVFIIFYVCVFVGDLWIFFGGGAGGDGGQTSFPSHLHGTVVGRNVVDLKVLGGSDEGQTDHPPLE